MIIYNFKYRGPFEYDKFILNTLQLNNEVNYLLNNGKLNELITIQSTINSKLNDANTQCNKIYMELLNYGRY